MKKLIFSIVAMSLLAAASGFAQDAGIKKASGRLVSGFESALRMNSIESFIAAYSIADAQLQNLVDAENKRMGIVDGDPDRFTLEQAQAFMSRMKSNFSASFFGGIEALEIISGIYPKDLSITDFTAQKSYWEPPVAEISILAGTEGVELGIRISNLSLVDGRPRLGPSSRIEFEGYQAQDLIAFHIIEALKMEDAIYFADMVLPDADGLEALMEAMAESGGYSPDETPQVMLMQVRKRLIADFEKLIETGIERGILWSYIDNLWSGYSAELQGGLYQVSIPFEFTFRDTGYRIVLEYCTQLASDLSVFLPGEFVW
ncbi:MAG: hypothetical protein JEZ04_06680 [Spirochaetales bacterium]|nr:hypothetical protein [Spirochaetales bacterium]